MSERPAFYRPIERPIPVRALSALWYAFAFPVGVAVGMTIATGADLAGVRRDHEALHRANLTIRCQHLAILQSDAIAFVPVSSYAELVKEEKENREACRELESLRAKEATETKR